MSRASIRSRASKQLAERQTPEINLSPLIDVVFLLLIFFIVTTVFVEETGIDIQRPDAVSATDLDKKSVLLALTADGRVMVGDKEISMDRVRGHVAAQIRGRAWPVILLADRAVPAGLLVDVMDECRLAGAETVNVAATLP